MATGLRDALEQQGAVIGALILRDMRTRFGRTALGFAIAIAWPLTHLLVMVGTFTLLKHVIPFGTSGVVFFTTGILPYILCLYPGRMMMFAIDQNRQMLLFPIVKIFDIIIARSFLEFITAMSVLVIFCVILMTLSVDFYPKEPDIALAAIALTILYGLSFGFISCIIIIVFRMWLAGFIGLIIIQWVTSGAMQPPAMIPSKLVSYMVYNPLFHCIAWLRSAYYDGYADGLVDPWYVVQVSLVLIVIGLASERAVRGKLLNA